VKQELFPVSSQDQIPWRALAFFSVYRIIIAFIFATLVWLTIDLPEPLGIFDHGLFQFVIQGYLLAAILLLVPLYLRVPRFSYQVAGQVFIDIGAITLLMFASAGVGSGFGMLLIVAVAGGSLLKPGRIAYLFASVATLAVLGEEIYSHLVRFYPAPNFTYAGMLGIVFFITAFICHTLAFRVRESEALAARRTRELENLARLNEHIVQHMQSGIVVLDADDRVRLMNTSAHRLLSPAGAVDGEVINAVCPEVAEALRRWRTGRSSAPEVICTGQGDVDVQLSFRDLSTDNAAGVLVFIEDASTLRQRAQHMKLASLGRMAASIAHELKNPLGAISHAGQLLSESEALRDEDQRLTHIIRDHSLRVNAIIENVMRISRRQPAMPQNLKIHEWLMNFADDFRQQKDLGRDAITVSVEPPDMILTSDPGQLQQVLWNLCDNAIRYSKTMPLVELQCGIRAESERPYLDVVDHGAGINDEIAKHLFEPFVTSETSGTGLGLFIARELCEANQASLALYSNTEQGCRFRISFPHPDKHHVVE
jgi:two-component system, NtrC family, sensor histidine kinase PilS